MCDDSPSWRLDWNEEFNDPMLDPKVWNIVDHGERVYGRNALCLSKNVAVHDGIVELTTLKEVRRAARGPHSSPHMRHRPWGRASLSIQMNFD